MKLIVENVRSFAGRHEFEIRPLTLLVGENSSGKSTFLAALAAVSDPTSFPSVASLNKAPYDLGTFDTIATYKGGRSGRAKSFSIGYEVEPIRPDEVTVEALATFCSEGGETRLKKLQFKEEYVGIAVTWDDEQTSIQVTGTNGAEAIENTVKNEAQLFVGSTITNILYSAVNSISLPKRGADGKLSYDPFHELMRYVTRWVRSVPHATSIAPIRSKPKRTYDRLGEEYDPSGDHIPFALARILQKGDLKKSKALLDSLITFGQDSGLFQGLGVKRLGTRAGDPFQVQITVGGPAVNLSDVGYGVSQSLPVVVESILRARGARILLQQPEVHLHPRAQAALGSFFAALVAEEERQFVIETHSDYLIDRVRQEVASGRLPAEAVSILFFDRPHIETTVFEMTLDQHGNIQNAPANYRDFFLHEELRLLSRAES